MQVEQRQAVLREMYCAMEQVEQAARFGSGRIQILLHTVLRGGVIGFLDRTGCLFAIRLRAAGRM